MFNIATLKTNLIGMIGLRDTPDPDFPLNNLTGATESVFYDDYHPFITYDNLYWICPNFDGMNYTKWISTGYSTGAYVMFDNVAYQAGRTMLTGDTPSLTSTAWTTPVIDWLTNKENASINKLCNDLFTSKKMNEAAKTFLDSVQVVDGAGRQADTITALGRFVGFEIKLKRANNLKAVINNIGLQFTQVQSPLLIYLFHSSQKAAVGTWSLTSAAATSFDWLPATSPTSGTNELHYVNYSLNIDSGGTYYLGYFEDDITGSAIDKELGCGYCGGYPNSTYKWSQYAEIRPFQVVSGGLDGTNIFDINQIGYSNTNYGLNLSFSIKSDITEMIVNNKALFTHALGYQFANDMLKEMLFNPNSRINKNQDTMGKNAALYEFNAPDDPDSIANKLKDSKDALSYDLSKISQVVPNKEGRRVLKAGAM